MIKFIDLFAGIGGIRVGFEQACEELGIPCGAVLSSDIDKNCQSTYELNFNEKPLGDMYDIKKYPKFDFLLAGFPCQPFSYAGKQRGFGDTRGTLFFEIEKVLKSQKPKGFLLENVKGLTTHDKGNTFKTIVKHLEDLGYGVKWFLINSATVGVPQNRQRVYIVGLRNTEPKMTISSDHGSVDTHHYKSWVKQASLFESRKMLTVEDILEKNADSKYYCSPSFTKRLKKVVGADLSKLNGVRLIDFRNGNSIHSWELGIKGDCSKKETELMNAIVAHRRLKQFGSHQDGKSLTIDNIESFYKDPELPLLLQNLLARGYLSYKEGKYNPVAGNMSFEIYKFLDPQSISVTLVASDAHKIGVVQNGIPRHITPREAARIQGFPDTFKLHPVDSIAYKQLGNSVAVPVIKMVLADYLSNNVLLKETKVATNQAINIKRDPAFAV